MRQAGQDKYITYIYLYLLLASTVPISAEPWTPGLVYPLSAGADLISTHRALSIEGTRESNPFMRGSLQEQLVVKALATSAMVWLDLKLQRQGRIRAAWVLRGVWILVHGLVVAHNLGAQGRH